jgi:hypothetical protein
MWLVWSIATLLLTNLLLYAQQYFKWALFKKLTSELYNIDQQFIRSHLLRNMSAIKILKALLWYITFTCLSIIYMNIFLIFFIYYVIRLFLLRRWEQLEPLYISNVYGHRFLSYFFMLPNAFAYYILILIIDLLSKQELLNYKQLIFIMILRLVLGFSPLFIYTLELIYSLNLKLDGDRKVFFDKLLVFYSGILHHYYYRKIIRLENSFTCVEYFK